MTGISTEKDMVAWMWSDYGHPVWDFGDATVSQLPQVTDNEHTHESEN